MGRMVPAVARALDILEFLRSAGPSSAPEIAKALALPRTTVHELVKTLEARYYLQTADTTGRFGLGIRLFELGSAYHASLDLIQITQAKAVAVGNDCGETVHVAVLDNTDVVYIVRIQSTHVVRMVSTLGGRVPAHLTAVGKSILAYQPTEILDKLYPPGHSLPAMTENSLATTDTLREALRLVRREGVAWDHCESNPDVFCVGAPILDSASSVVAGISISVPAQRWTDERAAGLAILVTSAARAMSAQLGFPGESGK